MAAQFGAGFSVEAQRHWHDGTCIRRLPGRGASVCPVVVRIAGRRLKRSGSRKIVRCEFETRGRMGEQLSFGDSPDAAVAVPEGLQDPRVAGLGFKPEVRFQRQDRDHAFNRAVPMDEAERHAAAIRQYLRFKIEGFHKAVRDNASRCVERIFAQGMLFEYGRAVLSLRRGAGLPGLNT